MPVEEDYGRRQISLQQHGSQSPVPIQCPVGCLSASADHRYSSDKNLLDSSERYSERFGPERSSSDRLPSGERYQGVSERYPLGERPQTSISSERLIPKEILQTSGHCQQDERYHYATGAACQRYPERYTPVPNVGSLDRYQATIDRYSRTNTPTDRYHTLSIDKDKTGTSERFAPIDKYQGDNFSANDRHNSAQSVCSIERYTPTERHRSGAAEMYKIRERSASSDRQAERYQQYQYVPERFPAIPCPERFATQERIPFTQVPYMEPPSPAPAGDRFVPPPPLSPENTPSPDCFPNNSFPSPTAAVPPPERFMPPPPLSPSPTEKYSPKKMDRYDKSRYHQTQNERYHRTQYYPPNERYHVNGPDRFANSERYIPPNAHMPVERYVPQQQEQYYNTYQHQQPTYDRFGSTVKFNANDPYMRRDLAFHYRLPLPYPSNQYQRMRYSHVGTPNRVKCCQYQEGYQLSKSSPGSSSSSSVTSQGKELHQKDVQCVNNASLQEMQCQNYQNCTYQQEKGTQCGKECVGFVSPNLRGTKGQCRHNICPSPGVEYVGASGGRHVCATPPPRGSIGSADGSICNDTCCMRRSQNSLTVSVW